MLKKKPRLLSKAKLTTLERMLDRKIPTVKKTYEDNECRTCGFDLSKTCKCKGLTERDKTFLKMKSRMFIEQYRRGGYDDKYIETMNIFKKRLERD